MSPAFDEASNCCKIFKSWFKLDPHENIKYLIMSLDFTTHSRKFCLIVFLSPSLIVKQSSLTFQCFETMFLKLIAAENIGIVNNSKLAEYYWQMYESYFDSCSRIKQCERWVRKSVDVCFFNYCYQQSARNLSLRICLQIVLTIAILCDEFKPQFRPEKMARFYRPACTACGWAPSDSINFSRVTQNVGICSICNLQWKYQQVLLQIFIAIAGFFSFQS